MAEHFPLLVPGAEGEGPDAEVFAPFDRTLIATVACAGASGTEQALKTAYALFRDRDRWLSPARRIEVLQAAAAIMAGRREQLAVEAAREGGKPLVDSLVEVDRAIDGVRLCVECLRTQAGREVPMGLNAASAGRLAFTRHEPVGVVVAFSAFNHPLNLIVHQVGPAVAAGCPVIVKPAKAAPLSCWRFVEILREAGLPAEWCQALLTGDEELNRRLAGNRRVGFFSFIVITWDDAEGDYDHVQPPIVNIGPDKTALSFGPRVPLIMISPYAKLGYVSSQQGSHSSVVKFVQHGLGVRRRWQCCPTNCWAAILAWRIHAGRGPQPWRREDERRLCGNSRGSFGERNLSQRLPRRRPRVCSLHPIQFRGPSHWRIRIRSRDGHRCSLQL